ncbi:hypothetical protein [Pseudomonas fontis]|uniref:Uncharacterized protein n=1 Tax=Pseudomonas fontis TaxID=2942633 RepID=A0ABT5NR91_9PSED|nr:hypothetical protein [Pseudomonas fontis]MDD0973432.1 hypothetical protein [Pseudomonas fontis]MDD0990681.1 hypothetical protein [Pseudomonas fontis]
MVRRLLTRVLQSVGLPLVGYLYICLSSARLAHEAFTLELPYLVEPQSNSSIELLIFSAPGMLLFVLLGCLVRRHLALIAAFIILAGASAFLLCQLFAESAGATWSSLEIVSLFAYQLPWLLLALVPGLIWLLALERWPGRHLPAYG